MRLLVDLVVHSGSFAGQLPSAWVSSRVAAKPNTPMRVALVNTRRLVRFCTLDLFRAHTNCTDCLLAHNPSSPHVSNTKACMLNPVLQDIACGPRTSPAAAAHLCPILSQKSATELLKILHFSVQLQRGSSQTPLMSQQSAEDRRTQRLLQLSVQTQHSLISASTTLSIHQTPAGS